MTDPVELFTQKPDDEVRTFWDSTAEWRLSYFEELKHALDEDLSYALRCEKEFVLREEEIITSLVTNAQTVVELGCGVGRSILPLIKRFPRKRFIGIDFATKQVQLFQKQLIAEQLDNAVAIESNVADMPLATHCCDVVLICNQTFGTFLGEVRACSLKQCHRILRVGGHLVIGGFTAINLAEACYSEWRVPVAAIDYLRAIVTLQHYRSWWRSEEEVNRELADFAFDLVSSSKVRLGYINTYRRRT